MTDDATPETETVEPVSGRTGDRLAWFVFAAFGIVAFVYFLVVGRHLWFYFDEWDFLAARSLNVHGLLTEHGGHLVALPVIEFRVLFELFGLHSYLPYQAVVVALHVTTAWLLRVVMRRAGVNAWIATAAATLFLFFGAGGADIIWAFQVTFVGALAFGLGQLLLADHDGPLDRRDWFGLALGFGAIACSGVGVTMVVVAGVVALIRRNWRAAAFHALPPLVIWLIWRHENPARPAKTTTNITLLFRWTRRGLEATLQALGHVPFVGWLLAALLVIGLVFFWRALAPGERRRAVAVPVAMLLGAAVFLVTTGGSRLSLGVVTAGSSRYIYIIAALLLPPLAVAADALARRRRVLLPVVIVLLIVGIPGNLPQTTDSFPSAAASASFKQMMLSVPRSSLARRVPRTLRPAPSQAPQVTIGWLLDEVRAGRLPEPKPVTPAVRATNVLRLSLEELDVGVGRRCTPVRKPRVLRLAAGESVVVRGSLSVRLLADGLPAGAPLAFGSTFVSAQTYHTLVAVAGPLSVRVGAGSLNAAVC